MLLPVCGAGGGRRGRRKRQAGVGFRTCGPPPKGPAAEGYRRRDCCRERGRKPDRIGRGARDAGALPLRGRFVAGLYAGRATGRHCAGMRGGRMRGRFFRKHASAFCEVCTQGAAAGEESSAQRIGKSGSGPGRCGAAGEPNAAAIGRGSFDVRFPGRPGRRLRPGGRSSVGRMRQGAGAGRAVRAADRKADGRKEDAGCG